MPGKLARAAVKRGQGRPALSGEPESAGGSPSAIWTVVIVAGLVIVAYGVVLIGLIEGIFRRNATGFTGFIPPLGLFLLIRTVPAKNSEPHIYDRFTDYVVGIPLLAMAVLLLLLFPVHSWQLFWEGRLDLLSLALFTPGCIAVVFGARTLWRVRAVLAFLLLLLLVPLLSPIESDQALAISLKSITGGLIVGIAVGFMLTGNFWRKAGWVGGIAALTWAITEAGIWVTRTLGLATTNEASGFALIELLALLLATGLAIMVASKFRLSFSRRIIPAIHPRVITTLASADTDDRTGSWRSLGVVAIAAALTLILTLGLPSVAPILTPSGGAGLSAGGVLAPPKGWSLETLGASAWVKRYYGPTAADQRYRLLCGCANSVNGDGSPSIEVVTTQQNVAITSSELSLIHPLRHSRLVSLLRVDLGRGVIGQVAVYEQLGAPDWVAVLWEWPVRSASGTAYQHFVIQALAPGRISTASSHQPSSVVRISMLISDWLDDAPSRAVLPATGQLRDNLIALAQAVVAAAGRGQP